jgi:type II secretory pathway pseudopilin PulG
MAPPPAATANAPARRHASGSGARVAGSGSGTGSALRSPLAIVRPLRRAREHGQRRRNPARLLNVVAVTLILGSLLAVVIGQALLANGQVRLSALQHQLTLEQSAHRQAELAVSQLETPSRIVAAASGQLHMVRPSQVIELPYVSLSTPLPTPKVTPAPPPPPPSASASPSAGTTSGTGSATSGTTGTGTPGTSGTAGTSGTTGASSATTTGTSAANGISADSSSTQTTTSTP